MARKSVPADIEESSKALDNKFRATRERQQRQAQDRLEKVLAAHNVTCELVERAVHTLNQALASVAMLDRAIQVSGLRRDLYLSRRLRVDKLKQDLGTAGIRLLAGTKMSRLAAKTNASIFTELLSADTSPFE